MKIPKPSNPRVNHRPQQILEVPKPKIHEPEISNGLVVSNEVKRKIRATLLSGRHPKMATIARENGVSVDYVNRMLQNDPELAASVKTSLQITAEQVEQAAVDMCLDEEINPIARQKMIEFCLPKMMPERYGENAGLSDAAKNLPKISVSLTLPVIEKKEEVIEIKSESSLNG